MAGARRSIWSTRYGFYLAAIGSACGLGNLWRFPFVAVDNGGGAFVLLYVLLALTIGLPLLIGELILGKSTGRGVLSAMSTLEFKKKKPFRWIGFLALCLSIVLLSYYAVISGWVLHFATQFFVSFVSGKTPSPGNMIALLINNGYLQVALASVHLLFSIIIVSKGVQEGLERVIGKMMPVFGILVLILLMKAISLPSAGEALRFMFYPDFSKLNGSSLVNAIGHVCFTLSVGFGTMVTFGSYFKDDELIPLAGFKVAVLDTVLSLISGLLVFCVALQAMPQIIADPALLFEVLPNFLLSMPGGLVFGFFFFVCLYMAALGASIGLLEVVVSNGLDRFRASRIKTSWVSGALCLVIALVPAFSSSTFRQVNLGGRGLLQALDSAMINWVLPLIALGMSVAISLGLSNQQKERLFVDDQRIETAAIFSHWKFAIKWLVPTIISIALLIRLFSIFLS